MKGFAVTQLENQQPTLSVSMLARIAVYDDFLSAPQIIDIKPAPILEFIENIASTTYQHALQLGGRIPYSAIREIAENFIHANFQECTVSVMDHGNTIRFSDQGPGIDKKLLVQQPGVSSASNEMRQYIKGVGSGFPLVKEYLEIHNGSIRIDENALDGSVITLTLQSVHPQGSETENPRSSGRDFSPNVGLNTSFSANRQKLPIQSNSIPAARQFAGVPKPENTETANLSVANTILLDERSLLALDTISRLGAAGPTDLAMPMGISTATAHRLLQSLEKQGLLSKTINRKRILSNHGLEVLNKAHGYQGR